MQVERSPPVNGGKPRVRDEVQLGWEMFLPPFSVAGRMIGAKEFQQTPSEHRGRPESVPVTPFEN